MSNKQQIKGSQVETFQWLSFPKEMQNNFVSSQCVHCVVSRLILAKHNFDRDKLIKQIH